MENFLRAALTEMMEGSAYFVTRSMLFETTFLDLGKETLTQGLSTLVRSEDGEGLGRVLCCVLARWKKPLVPGWFKWTGEKATKWNWHLLRPHQPRVKNLLATAHDQYNSQENKW